MKHFKNLGAAAVAAIALLSLVGAGTASATTLEVKGVKQTGPVAIEMSLAAGTSAILKDKNGTTQQTCTGSITKGSTTSPFTGTSVQEDLSSFTFTGCTHTTDVLNPGKLSITWTSGTNGTISSSEAEWTTVSTVFGASATCKTGSGTVMGSLTGVNSGRATFHINATTLNCGILGTSSWTGTYTVTSPEGLGVVS